MEKLTINVTQKHIDDAIAWRNAGAKDGAVNTNCVIWRAVSEALNDKDMICTKTRIERASKPGIDLPASAMDTINLFDHCRYEKLVPF